MEHVLPDSQISRNRQLFKVAQTFSLRGLIHLSVISEASVYETAQTECLRHFDSSVMLLFVMAL